MKKLIIFLFLAILIPKNLLSQDSVRIFGKVTDFDSKPLDSVTVRLKNKQFENLYETITDKNGNFSFKAQRGIYSSLYAIKRPDYGKTKLEYWAWNVPAFKDLEINPQYQKMELYGLNAFEPQVGPWETYMVYFRPMSLTKGLELRKIMKEQNRNVNDLDTIDVAPSQISKEELSAYINGIESKVLNIFKLPEYARGTYMYGYIVQILKPKEIQKQDVEYDKITIVLNSKETGDIGKSDCFIKRTK